MGKETKLRIYDFDSYKDFLRAVSEREGRGFFQDLAKYLRVHSSLVSQIASGGKHPTEEQACAIAERLGLDPRETEYLLMLVLKERAGNDPMRRFVKDKLRALHLEAEKPSSRVKPSGALSEADKAEFYSHWHYSAVRLMTSIKGYQTPEAIARAMGIAPKQVEKILGFLVSRGLVKKEDSGYALGLSRTHEPSDSPYVLRHHLNWRLKAIERLPDLPPSRLAFSCPFTASVADEERLRKCVSNFLAEFNQIVDQSPAEKLYCLNVDWFDL